jgi:hypothetical protein
MPAPSFRNGSILTADVRRDIAGRNSTGPIEFVVRASHPGNMELSYVLLDGRHVFRERKRSSTGVFVVPLPASTAAGQRLTWSLIPFFDLPEVGSYTRIGNLLNYLDAKRTETKAGTPWASWKELQSRHVDP